MRKIVVRDAHTRLFHKEGGGWTDDLDKALQFPNATGAVAFCEEKGLGNYEVISKAHKERGDTVVFQKVKPVVA